MGLVAGAQAGGAASCSCGSYPITPGLDDPATSWPRYKHFGVITFQAEDEIAAICAAIGASYAGTLGVDRRPRARAWRSRPRPWAWR